MGPPALIIWQTTTISIARYRRVDGDDYADPVRVVVASGVGADITYVGGQTGRGQEGTTVATNYTILANPCDMQPNDVITDEKTGIAYHVEHCHLSLDALYDSVYGGIERFDFEARA